MVGMLLSFKTWWLVLLGGLAYWIFIERIIAVEERFLTEKFGQVYTEWARKTPIIIPDLRLWQKAALPFSWKKVLRSEYNGVFAVGAVFFISDFILDIFIEREPVGPWMRDDWFWIFEFAVATGGLVILRHLKKNTGLLTLPAETQAPAQGNN
jgi:hypothetical protein